MTPIDLRSLRARELKTLLSTGRRFDLTRLSDRVFHGTSLGLPRLIERLTWTTFVKAFHWDPEWGVLRGWNVRTEPGTWTPQLRKGNVRAFGHFLVRDTADGVLLDYSALNPAWSPLGRLRDPLVELPCGLLLGTTDLALGTRLRTASYFCLEPGAPLGTPIPAPRQLTA